MTDPQFLLSCHDDVFKATIVDGGYERLISKPPAGIEDWPLSRIIEFKDAVAGANTSFVRCNRNRSEMLRFLNRARVVIEFYALLENTSCS